MLNVKTFARCLFENISIFLCQTCNGHRPRINKVTFHGKVFIVKVKDKNVSVWVFYEEFVGFAFG